MVKVKNKKSKNLADNYAKKRRQQQLTKKTLTPFEVHINKDKQKILGRKSKADKGLPGVARSKAIVQRKNTLLHEYKVKNKDNIFLDKRIGEKNIHMTQEDKAMARFAREKIKAHSKKNIFNLNDDEVLTHRGQTLMDIEKYDNPRSDDDGDSDDDKGGKLNKKFVAEAHFGGGILSKPDSEMSRKDLIDQLIAESKKRKAERQQIREQTIDLTEKLDSEWRDLLPLVNSSHKADKSDVEVKTKVDDYDKSMRELKFEARGNPTDKLKSEEAIEREEKEKLEKLEQDRLARMQGFRDEDERRAKHRSADDLDDFHIEKIEENSDNEDESNLKSILKKKDSEDADNDEDGEDDEEEESDEEEEEDEEDEADDDEDEKESSKQKGKEQKKGKQNEGEDEEEEEEEEEDNEDDDEEEDEDVNEKASMKKDEEKEAQVDDGIGEENSSEESDDDLSDLKDSESSDSDEKFVFASAKKKKTTEKPVKSESKVNSTDNSKSVTPKTVPQPKPEEKIEQLDMKNPALIVDKVLRGSNWRLTDKNKENALNLFSYMIQYIDKYAAVESTKEVVNLFEIFERLSPHLYDLAHADPSGTKGCLHDILKEKHDKFENNIKTYPGFDTIILFKLVSILYPTSDFRHPIVTPCLVFMSQILLRCKLRRKQDISKGLFICTLVLEYNLLSKRWSPEAINFLRGVVYVSLPKPFPKVVKVIPPFKSVGETSTVLVLEENHSKSDISIENTKILQAKDLVEDEINDDYRIRTFISAVNLLSEYMELCKDLDAQFLIFEPILTLLTIGSLERYPKKIQKKVQALVDELKILKEKVLEPLALEKKKPKALRMYEPKIEVVRDGRRHKPMSKEKAELEKLKHKLKMEKKSAIREVRRDNAFISKVRLTETLASDAERKRKVKEIFGDAAMQQHELKKFKKK